MNEDWFFCLTPDWAHRSKGLFRQNTNITDDDFRFWYNRNTGAKRSPDDPPPLLHHTNATPDNIGFAVEITQTAGADDFQVDNVRVVSSAKEVGAKAATQASPFKSANTAGEFVCQKSEAPTVALTIGGRSYIATGPYRVHRDGNRTNLSAYELTVVVDASHGLQTSDFSYDPEMDVDNN